AVGVASAFEASVDAIAIWANEARARGIEIVPVSATADDPEGR
ncbi:MAG: divergent polysaccharide deacetylase family protein, partial [Hoeflea sp.]|nr:divergent polysaccharide deacetylase family protein [Hoeflea sp.]